MRFLVRDLFLKLLTLIVAPPSGCLFTTVAVGGDDHAQPRHASSSSTAASKSAYAGVFYNNNFDYLNDPWYSGPNYLSDPLKNIDTRLGRLSLGGETRVRYHNERNHRGLGITGRDDNFWLTRQRLYADWRLNPRFRFYGEVLDARSSGETFAPRPIEENELDFQNLFGDVLLFDNGYGSLTARVGRQELLLGNQRLISPLDWANTRRTFEGVRLQYRLNDTAIDGFWTEFVPPNKDRMDRGDNQRQFYGVYGSRRNMFFGQADAYYLGYDNKTVGFSYHTLGSRVLGETAGGMLYELENAYQFGENANQSSHDAAFVTAGVGRALDARILSPTIWCYYDYASGEDDFAEAGRGDNGFEHLFPLAHKYNGFMDLFGRRNLHDLNIFSSTPLNDKVSLIVWYHYFALAEKTTPYNVVMQPSNTATQAESRDLGHEIDLLVNINMNARNNVLIGYSHFAAGEYFDQPGISQPDGDNDADFFYTHYQLRY